MNRNEINLFDMLQSVDEFLTQNASLIQNQPALVSAYTQLHSINEEIFNLNQRQSVSTTTETALKSNQKKEMIQILLKVAGAMAAHAAATDDIKLRLTVTLSEWELKNMRENDLVIKAKAIYDAALPLAAQIASWGVTQAELDLLGVDFTEFKQKTPDIRNMKVQSTQATATLKEKLDEGKTLLKEKIDAMMLPFKSSNPAFYGEYSNTRAIVGRAAGHGSKVTGSGEVPVGDGK